MDHPDDPPVPLSKYVRNDPMADHLGIEVVEIRAGCARGRMKVRPENLNAHGVAHGGTTMTLADTVFAAPSNSYGRQALAVDLHTEFLSAGVLDDVLACEAVELSSTHRMAVYRLTLVAEAEADGRPAAAILARAYRRDQAGP